MSSGLPLNFFFKNKKRLIISFLLSCILTSLFYIGLSIKKNKIYFEIFFELNDNFYKNIMNDNVLEEYDRKNYSRNATILINSFFENNKKKIFLQTTLNLDDNKNKIIEELNSLSSNLKVVNLTINRRGFDLSPLIKLSYKIEYPPSNKDLLYPELVQNVKKIVENYSTINKKKEVDALLVFKIIKFEIHSYQIFSVITFLFFTIYFILNRTIAKKYFKF